MAKQDSHSNKAYDYLLALLAQTNDKAHLAEIRHSIARRQSISSTSNR